MSRNQLVAATALTALAVAGGVLTAGHVPAVPSPIEPVEISAAIAAAPPAVAVLRHWDEQRAAAWAQGDPGLLRALYTPGSQAGKHDRAMLRAWTARGLTVRGLQTQLLSVRELGHTRTTWTVQVTDRLAHGLAVGAGVSQQLPRDHPTTRTVRLRLVDGRWRVAAVRLTSAG